MGLAHFFMEAGPSATLPPQPPSGMGRTPSVALLEEGVSAAFNVLPSSIQLGKATQSKPGKGLDRSATLEVLVGSESMAMALVAEGIGEPDVVDWVRDNLLSVIVRLANNDPNSNTA